MNKKVEIFSLLILFTVFGFIAVFGYFFGPMAIVCIGFLSPIFAYGFWVIFCVVYWTVYGAINKNADIDQEKAPWYLNPWG
jgi:purine-cytosine permease-like protein